MGNLWWFRDRQRTIDWYRELFLVTSLWRQWEICDVTIGKWHRHITQICVKDKLYGFEYPTKSGGRGSKHPTGHAWIIFLPWRRCFVGMLFLLTNSFLGEWQIHITQSQEWWQHRQLLAKTQRQTWEDLASWKFQGLKPVREETVLELNFEQLKVGRLGSNMKWWMKLEHTLHSQLSFLESAN